MYIEVIETGEKVNVKTLRQVLTVGNSGLPETVFVATIGDDYKPSNQLNIVGDITSKLDGKTIKIIGDDDSEIVSRAVNQAVRAEYTYSSVSPYLTYQFLLLTE